MDKDEILADYAWFTAEAESWAALSGYCSDVVNALLCIKINRIDSRHDEIYDAYESIQAAFVSAVDSMDKKTTTGTGYGAGAQVCGNMPDTIKEVGRAYALAEARTTELFAWLKKYFETH